MLEIEIVLITSFYYTTGTKFHFEQTIFIFWTKFAKTVYFLSKTKK